MNFRLICLLSILIISSVSALNIEEVSVVPAVLQPGESANIELYLVNNADKKITDVMLGLELKDLPFAPYLSSSHASIDEIKDGDSEEVNFKLVALNDAESGTYKIPVSISYLQDSEKKQVSSTISLIINSKPEISINSESVSLIKGLENEISIRATNKGLGNAKFLEIVLEESNYYTLVSPKEVYIGDLESDDFDSAEYKILVKENAQKNLILPVTITYLDSLNEQTSQTKTISLKAYSLSEARELGLISNNNTFSYAVIVIVVIVLIILLRYLFKRKRRKMLEES